MIDVLEALMAGNDLPAISDILHPPHWHAGAECRKHPEITWFPVLGQPAAPAKRICAVCPVRLECLAWSVERAELDGIWGGLSTLERRRLRRTGAA